MNIRRSVLSQSSAIALIMAALSTPAFAANILVQAAENGDQARMVFRWDEGRAAAPTITHTLEEDVLTLRFTDPTDIDVDAIVQGLGHFVISGRLNAKRDTLVLALKRKVTVRNTRSYDIAAIDLVPDGAAAPPPIRSPLADEADRKTAEAARAAEAAKPKPLKADVNFGEIDAVTRIALDWGTNVPYNEFKDGNRLTLRFSRAGIVDLAPIRVDLPKRVQRISGANDDNRYSLIVEAAPGSDFRVFRDGTRTIIDLKDIEKEELKQPDVSAQKAAQKAALTLSADGQRAAQNSDDATNGPQTGPLTDGPIALVIPAAPNEPSAEPNQPVAQPKVKVDPVPKNGVVKVSASETRDGLILTTDWAGPAPAAAFRRGDGVFILFGAKARLDLASADILRRRAGNVQVIQGNGLVGLAFQAPAEEILSAKSEGNRWTFTLSRRGSTPPRPAISRREAGPDGRARLRVQFPELEQVGWIDDPFAGDRIAVGLASGPERGVLTQRSLLEGRLLSTAQGVAAEIFGDGVVVEAAPAAFLLASGSQSTLGDAAFSEVSAADARGITPGFIDFANWQGANKYRETYARLQRNAQRAAPGSPQARDAHLAVARFLIANELGPEGLGALKLALENDLRLEGDAHFHALRGVANALIGRDKEAKRDLNNGALSEDPNAALWLAYLETDEGDWTAAAQHFNLAGKALEAYSPVWRARFRAAAARTAIELGDYVNAGKLAQIALQDAPTDKQVRQVLVTQAVADAQSGGFDRGLATLDQLSRDRDDRVAVLAELARARLGLESGVLAAGDVVDRLESLRYRWRGDAIELQAIEFLGAFYAKENRWREAFAVMHSAISRPSDLPAVRRLKIALADGFRTLFVENASDQLEPIEALGLFYQFRDLAPQGPEGDEAVRKLAKRLVAFDLLPQAADLLQHQVDRRLQGEGEARVAADLASIYLINREPEKALRALRETRQPRLGEALRRDRRVLEAAALAGLQRYEQAQELLEGVEGEDSARLRADVAWKQKDWSAAAADLIALLPKPGTPFARDQQALALRATVATSLGGNKAALAKLGIDYSGAMANGPYAEAFALLVREPERGAEGLRQAAQKIADAAALDGFLAALRRKFAPNAV